MTRNAQEFAVTELPLRNFTMDNGRAPWFRRRFETGLRPAFA